MPKKKKKKNTRPTNEEFMPPSYLSDAKVHEVKQKLRCNLNEAKNVLLSIKQSNDLRNTNKGYGSAYGLPEIEVAMNEMGCNAEKAANILFAFQYYPDLKDSINYSKISYVMDKHDCDPKEAFELCMNMIQNNIPVSHYSIIKSIMKKVECNVTDAIETIDRKRQLPLYLQYYINYDKIKEAKEAIGCTSVEAVIALRLIYLNHHPEDYDEIKKTRKALGHDISIEDTLHVLAILKKNKKYNLEPLFNLNEIPPVMKGINGDVNEAMRLLFALQINQWPKTIKFSFSDIIKIKELIGDVSSSIEYSTKLYLVIKLAVTKQMYINGFASHKKWNDILREASRSLKPSIIVELMKMTWKEKNCMNTNLSKMIEVQSVKSSSSTTSTTTNNNKKGAKKKARTSQQGKKNR